MLREASSCFPFAFPIILSKLSSPLLLTLTLFIAHPDRSGQENYCRWKGEPSQILTKNEVNQEVAEKTEGVHDFLVKEDLDGMLLTQVRNFHWMTAGTVDNQIVLNKDVGAASLLIMRDGKKYLICTESEVDLLMDGGLRELGYQPKIYHWYEANPVKDVRGDIIKELAGNGKIGSDAPFPNTFLVSDKFAKLRYSFTETEIKRYRWLGHQVAEAVEDVCRALKPGMKEHQIEAMTAEALWSRGILPTVLLIGVDDRIYKYRHCLPDDVILKHYAMVNVVAEKWGMPIAMTRFVHFGTLPEDLATNIKKVATVMAHFEVATVPGTSCENIFKGCENWYAEVGFKGEWRNHHQGGAIGYNDREYVIYPGINEVVQENQPFAWNPTLPGTKVEDTMIAFKGHFEVITQTKTWPMIKVNVAGKTYEEPTILVR